MTSPLHVPPTASNMADWVRSAATAINTLIKPQTTLNSYTVANLPSAGTAGQMIYVTNESGGAVPAFSDGTNWRRVTDRAVVS